jgi:hypothetical protein
MGAVTPVLSSTQLAVELQAASLRTQIETVEEAGERTVALIRSAVLPRGTGTQLDYHA